MTFKPVYHFKCDKCGIEFTSETSSMVPENWMICQFGVSKGASPIYYFCSLKDMRAYSFVEAKKELND